MEQLSTTAINDLLSGKQSIKIGVDMQDAIILAVAIFVAIVLGGVTIKLITRNM